MKITRTMEVGVGLFVSLGLAALLMLALKVANISAMAVTEGYLVTAHFDNIGKLGIRSPVKMSGVVVGRVTRVDYDVDCGQAVVEMRIEKRFSHIPRDTSASIYTAGLLGEQYLSLDPGGEETFLKQGDDLPLTQSAVILERTIQQFLYSKTVQGNGKKKP